MKLAKSGFAAQEEDGTLKPVARVWLDKANKEVVYPNCNFSKPTKRYRWTKVDVHVSLGLPEFLIAK